MAGLPTGDTYVQSAFETGSFSHDKPEEDGSRWYFSRLEIEENSPSRRDGIDLKKESYLRKSYCTFLQDLGMRLKVPQVTIATAIIFCHRFFLRQSHSKNDRRNIATVCMFLAGKVEETPRPLKDVIITSYDIVHKKDSEAIQSKIKQKDVYEQQKELILLGERVVLATLGFDLNVLHPYKPLVEAIKKFKVAQNALAQVAWNFVNDGLRTSLCLQFKPHHIAAGAIFLAAKFLKVKLPSDGERVWWQEFDVTPRQLEEVSNQMLELYEQNRMLPSQASEAEGSAGTPRPPPRAPAASDSSKLASRTVSDQVLPEYVGPTQAAQVHDYETSEAYSHEDHKGDGELSDHEQHEEEASRYGSEGPKAEYQESSGGRAESWDAGEVKEEKSLGAAAGDSPQHGPKLDKNKLKAQIEKRRKSRPDLSRKSDVMDDDDLIERELEDGIELAAEDEKIKIERVEHDDSHHDFDNVDFPVKEEHGDGDFPVKQEHENFDNVEEGELEEPIGYQSRKRKPEDSPDKLVDGKQQRLDYSGSHNHNSHHDFSEDRSRLGRLGYSDRDHKRHVQENHV